MKIKRNPIANAIKIALYSGVIASVSMANVAFAQEDEDGSKEELDKVVVTGSRLSRTDIEGASPVEIFTREDIEKTGKVTVADFLREAPFNNFGSFNQRSGSSAQSQASLSLLGAGSDRTLILIDGKRLPGSPTFGGTSINLNTIPTGAIERIEVLRDGASAVYGSDAVAGVVNIITRKDFNGMHASIGTSRPTQDGADETYYSFVMGSTSDKGGVTVSFDHYRQDAIFDISRPYTRARFEDTDGDGIIERGSETSGVSNFGATITNPDTGLFEPSPLCNQLTATVPGFVGVLGEGNNASRGFVCGFAYANVSANLASSRRNSVIVSGDYDISDNVEVYARFTNTVNESFGRYAPPAAPWLGGVPANSANNPHDVPVNGRFRWYQLGNRDSISTDVMQDYIIGARGQFGASAEWEVYAHHNIQDNKNIGNTFLSFAGLFTNLFLDVDFSSEEGLSYLGATVLQNDKNNFDQYFAGLNFDFGAIRDVPMSHYVGVESQDIVYSSVVDRQSEAGLIGGSAGNSSGRNREVQSIFYEGLYTLTDTIEANLAVRYDKYNDFGSEVSPKLSLSWRPLDNLLVRASWGEGFRAPTLQELSAVDSFSASFATDYVLCQADGTAFVDCQRDQHNNIIQSNDQLGAETSEFLNIGAVYDFTDNFSGSIDYFNLKVDNLIGSVTVQDLIYLELVGDLDRVLTSFPSLGLDRAANGVIDEARTGTQNIPGFTTEGFNFNLNYSLGTDYGLFTTSWNTSWVISNEQPSFFSGPVQNLIGFNGAPEFRSAFNVNWSYGDHAVSWNIDYIGSTSDNSAPDIDALTASNQVLLAKLGHRASFTSHNVQYKYFADNWGTYTLGARNLFNRGPSLDDNGEYVNAGLYTVGNIGRVLYLNVSWDF